MDLGQLLREAGFAAESREPVRRDGREMPAASMAGDVALEAWRHLRGRVDELGHWPVVVGVDRLDDPFEFLADAEPVESILARSRQVDADALLARNPHLADESSEFFEPGDNDDVPEPPVTGEWPGDVEPNHSYAGVMDFQDGSFKPCRLILVPTTRPEEVFAWIPFGGWNDCPHDEQHVAVTRYWNERYGAEPVLINRDIVEMHVPRPPATREAAMTLAREQWAYCSDIVEQGTDTIEALAAGLLGSSVWFLLVGLGGTDIQAQRD